MYMYNSASSNQDESDITIINPSLLYDPNDTPITNHLPILRRAQQENHIQSINTSQTPDDNQDYLFVNHNSTETITQIESVLNFYRQDLKQESNSQFDCNQRLIRRLIDLVRPFYSSNEKQLQNLDILRDDISVLHEKRVLEQKEKSDQLQNKLRHLKKSIITAPIEDDDRGSLITNLYRMNNMLDYEQNVEIEEETKRLHNLVKYQREKIDELVEIIEATNHKEDPCFLPVTNQVFTSNYGYNVSEPQTPINSYLPSYDEVNPRTSLEQKQTRCQLCNELLSPDDDAYNYQHLKQCYEEMTGSYS